MLREDLARQVTAQDLVGRQAGATHGSCQVLALGCVHTLQLVRGDPCLACKGLRRRAGLAILEGDLYRRAVKALFGVRLPLA